MHLSLLILAMALAWFAAPASAQNDSAGRQPAPLVRVQPLSAVLLTPRREAPASLLARNEARISAQVSGTLLSWAADAGERVERGAVLAQIDARDYQLARDQARLALQSAQTRLSLAQAQLERARELVAKNFLSEEALNARETEVSVLRTEVATQRNRLATTDLALSRTRLRAPFDGTVSERLAQTGELVAPGTVLFVLTEAADVEVSAQVAATDVPLLRDSTDLVFESQGVRIPARVLRVAGVVTAPARTVEVRLRLATDPAEQGLRPGSAGRIEWQDTRGHVPASLIVQREGRLGLFTVDGETARFHPLPDAQEGRASRVDLPLQRIVVVSGQAGLQDGQRIQMQAR